MKNSFSDNELQVILSIVIVNSDGEVDTLACIKSILDNPPLIGFEIILMDNKSLDNCLYHVNRDYPQVRIYQAPERQGFAKNYNLGIRQSRGDIVIILNNDTLVQPGAIDAMLALIRNGGYGMVGPKLLSPNGRIQSVCARDFLTPISYVAWLFLTDTGLPSGKLWERYKQWKLSRRSSGDVACISGACMMVTRRAMDEAGLLDEGYEFYYEDVEWCHRMWKKGYRVGYAAEAEVIHIGDQSLSKVKALAKKSEYLSALRYFRSYYSIGNKSSVLLWIGTLLSYAMRAIYFGLISLVTGNKALSQAYQQVVGWIVTQNPSIRFKPFWVKPEENAKF